MDIFPDAIRRKIQLKKLNFAGHPFRVYHKLIAKGHAILSCIVMARMLLLLLRRQPLRGNRKSDLTIRARVECQPPTQLHQRQDAGHHSQQLLFPRLLHALLPPDLHHNPATLNKTTHFQARCFRVTEPSSWTKMHVRASTALWQACGSYRLYSLLRTLNQARWMYKTYPASLARPP